MYESQRRTRVSKVYSRIARRCKRKIAESTQRQRSAFSQSKDILTLCRFFPRQGGIFAWTSELDAHVVHALQPESDSGLLRILAVLRLSLLPGWGGRFRRSSRDPGSYQGPGFSRAGRVP